MTEYRIFELLLKNSNHTAQNEDFRQLQSELVDAASNTLTNSIYNSLKIKSTSSSHRRLNILKFVQSLACRNQRHDAISSKNYHEYVRAIILSSYSQETESDGNFDHFLRLIGKQLGQTAPQTLRDSILDYNNRRVMRTRNNVEEIERIHKIDLERLENAGFHLNHCTTIYNNENINEGFINELFPNLLHGSVSSEINQCNEIIYRHKQIKFAYSLHNFEKWRELEFILKRLKTYETLEVVELDFLVFLCTNCKLDPIVQLFIVENFPFVYEKLVIKTCTLLLKLQKDEDVSNFFEDLLLQSSQITILMEICKKNNSLSRNIKNLCFYLYTCSYCNSNMLRFYNFLMT